MKITYELLERCKSIGLLGLGVSNLGVLEFLKGFPSKRTVIRAKNMPVVSEIPKGAELMIGGCSLSDITEDILFLSPSARRDGKEICEAIRRGVIISSDAEAFFDLAHGRVLGITGSDGKSTTCELSYRLLSSGISGVQKSGNCGRSMLLSLDSDSPDATHIVELSSFMLEYMKPKLFRSVITNISENHLDWHGSYENYIRAKENILKNSDECALWYDDELCISLAKRYKPRTLISVKHTARELSPLCDHSVTLEGGRICICGTPILNTEAVRRSEPYNIKNFMSAAALCRGLFDPLSLCALAESFDGIEHRCKSLGIFDGIEYIDSSIDSSPERTRQTLEGLNKRLILILGGRGKGLSYAPLVKPVREYCEAVIICGENSDEIRAALTDDPEGMPPIYGAKTLKDAARLSREIPSVSKRVLLSPASTSYNEFKNFEERSKAFLKYIQN